MKSPAIDKYLRLKEHYFAIGMNETYLSSDEGEMPYDQATSCESGGMFRHGVATSISFKAQISGFGFRWTFDLENRDANGSGYLQPDMKRIREVMATIPAALRPDFRSALQTIQESIERSANETQAVRDKMYVSSAQLRSLTDATEEA